MAKISEWLWIVLAAICTMWFAGGCVLDDLAAPVCPEYDCSQCEVSIEDCLAAGLDLIFDDEDD